MSPFAFLLVPVVVVALASLVMWLRGRQPQTLHSGVDSFQREMQALSPDAEARRGRRFDAADRPGAPGRTAPPSRTIPPDRAAPPSRDA